MAEIITQLPGLKKRMLLSATDAEEIPEFTGLNRTVRLNFLPDAADEQESRLKLMKVFSPLHIGKQFEHCFLQSSGCGGSCAKTAGG